MGRVLHYRLKKVKKAPVGTSCSAFSILHSSIQCWIVIFCSSLPLLTTLSSSDTISCSGSGKVCGFEHHYDERAM